MVFNEKHTHTHIVLLG